MRTLRYLAGHPDPAALVASLSAGFPPAPDPEPRGAAATVQEPVAAPADERTAESAAIEGSEEKGR
jgi:hypothetical protein